MTTINRTYQTALRGQALHDAVDRMLTEMRGMRADYHDLTHRWSSSTTASISAGSAMSGTVTLRDGNPSTVTLNATMPEYVAFMRPQVEADIATLAGRHLAPAGGQTGSGVTAPPATSSGIDWARIEHGISEALQRLPGVVGQVRETTEATVAAARGTSADPNLKPGMRAPHEPDVAEATPLLQQPWLKWAAGGVIVVGVGYLLYRATR
jgi:hypothetical protein